jgi:Ser/Thr protein kinase RdoA (MazF antagonist)
VVDLATAFRWMPWRADRAGARASWRAWLSGYRGVREPPDAELRGVPPVACLQHLIWMIAEVGAVPDGNPQASWYFEDHCSAIEDLIRIDPFEGA